MNRPDARLLLPRGRLPFVPLGAACWSEGWNLGMGYTEVELAYMFATPDDLVDLSEPALRDGLPERLDVLPHALRVLARRHGWAGVPVSASRPTYHERSGCVVDLRDVGGAVVRSLVQRDPPAWRTPVSRVLVVEPFPNLSGLSPEEVSRAVVTAACVMESAR